MICDLIPSRRERVTERKSNSKGKILEGLKDNTQKIGRQKEKDRQTENIRSLLEVKLIQERVSQE